MKRLRLLLLFLVQIGLSAANLYIQPHNFARSTDTASPNFDGATTFEISTTDEDDLVPIHHQTIVRLEPMLFRAIVTGFRVSRSECVTCNMSDTPYLDMELFVNVTADMLVLGGRVTSTGRLGATEVRVHCTAGTPAGDCSKPSKPSPRSSHVRLLMPVTVIRSQADRSPSVITWVLLCLHVQIVFLWACNMQEVPPREKWLDVFLITLTAMILGLLVIVVVRCMYIVMGLDTDILLLAVYAITSPFHTMVVALLWLIGSNAFDAILGTIFSRWLSVFFYKWIFDVSRTASLQFEISMVECVMLAAGMFVGKAYPKFAKWTSWLAAAYVFMAYVLTGLSMWRAVSLYWATLTSNMFTVPGIYLTICWSVFAIILLLNRTNLHESEWAHRIVYAAYGVMLRQGWVADAALQAKLGDTAAAETGVCHVFVFTFLTITGAMLAAWLWAAYRCCRGQTKTDTSMVALGPDDFFDSDTGDQRIGDQCRGDQCKRDQYKSDQRKGDRCKGDVSRLHEEEPGADKGRRAVANAERKVEARLDQHENRIVSKKSLAAGSPQTANPRMGAVFPLARDPCNISEFTKSTKMQPSLDALDISDSSTRSVLTPSSGDYDPELADWGPLHAQAPRPSPFEVRVRTPNAEQTSYP